MRDKLALLGKRKYTIVIMLALIGMICWCVAGMLNNKDNKRTMKSLSSRRILMIPGGLLSGLA